MSTSNEFQTRASTPACSLMQLVARAASGRDHVLIIGEAERDGKRSLGKFMPLL